VRTDLIQSPYRVLPYLAIRDIDKLTEIEMRKEWRCLSCGKLLGVLRDGRLHLRFARGHEYLVGFPVTSTCRACRALNECDHAAGERPQPAEQPEPR
jgi:hypothetical protein